MLAVLIGSAQGGHAQTVVAYEGHSPPDLTAETRLVVRVVAHDAKIIGSGVGGARVTITDVASGAVLAEGVQEGSTGSTAAIVSDPIERGATVFDTPGAGAFRATLALDRPTLVEIAAEGPLGTPHAMQRASKTLWLVPSVHLEGEGVILFLNGFTVEFEQPVPESMPAGTPLELRVKVTMLCGCPTEPGGTWDTEKILLQARMVRGGDQIVSVEDLSFTGEASVYSGSLAGSRPGVYELQVIAADAQRANTGLVTREIVVR
jgi:hypothetical protein